jgi:hypothetical protein
MLARNQRKFNRFVCFVELYVIVNGMKVLSVAQKFFYGIFILPAAMKRTESCI